MISGPRDTVNRARKLRSEMSLPETVLWRELRKRPGGHKFRRQHPAGDFVLDFYCAKAQLDIEVDGWVHDNPVRTKQEQGRSALLRSQGIATTRVPAKRVLEDLDAVVRRIVVICDERIEKLMVPLPHPAAKTLNAPAPRSGEDQA